MTAALCAALAVAASVGFGACTVASVTATSLVTPAAARAAVTHHWDVNRQALRATSGAQAKRLIEQVESGDALKMDETIIMQQADARAASGGTQTAIADSTDIRVFVPRQTSYPAVFLSIRTEAQTDPSGVPTGKSNQVLELFRRTSAADAWRNVGYADIAVGLANKLDIALDKDGYAAFADGAPGGSELSTLYTGYVGALLGGHPDPAGKRVLAGPLTDQFVTQLGAGPGADPNCERGGHVLGVDPAGRNQAEDQRRWQVRAFRKPLRRGHDPVGWRLCHRGAGFKRARELLVGYRPPPTKYRRGGRPGVRWLGVGDRGVR